MLSSRPPPHSPLPLDFIPFPNVCYAPPSYPTPFRPPSLFLLSLSHDVLQIVGYSTSYSNQYIYMFLSAAVLFQGQSRANVLCCSLPQGFSLHTCCLSFRSLLCAGGPFQTPEEAGLLPHTDVHPSYNGCCAVPSLFLDQQRVCSCTHSCWYTTIPNNYLY